MKNFLIALVILSAAMSAYTSDVFAGWTSEFESEPSPAYWTCDGSGCFLLLQDGDDLRRYDIPEEIIRYENELNDAVGIIL